MTDEPSAEALPRLRLWPNGPALPLPPGERVLDALDEAWPGAGLPTACRAGNCGLCLVAVVSGAERLDPPAPRELQTLTTVGAAGDQRLGCQLRASSRPELTAEVVLRVIHR